MGAGVSTPTEGYAVKQGFEMPTVQISADGLRSLWLRVNEVMHVDQLLAAYGSTTLQSVALEAWEVRGSLLDGVGSRYGSEHRSPTDAWRFTKLDYVLPKIAPLCRGVVRVSLNNDWSYEDRQGQIAIGELCAALPALTDVRLEHGGIFLRGIAHESDATHVRAAQRLRHLTLAHTDIATVVADAARIAPNLTSLDVQWSRQVTSIAALAALAQLTELDISYLEQVESLAPLQRLPHLATLRAGGLVSTSGRASADALVADLGGLSALTSLDLRSNGLSAVPAFLQRASPAAPRIQVLVLDRNPLKTLPEALLTSLAGSLRVLRLAGCGLHQLPDAPAVYAQMAHLETLDLTENRAALPEALWMLPGLRDLVLVNVGLTLLPAALFHSPVAATLRSLSIHDSFAAPLPAGQLPLLTALRKLHLVVCAGDRIGKRKDILESIDGALAGMRNLEDLSFSDTPFMRLGPQLSTLVSLRRLHIAVAHHIARPAELYTLRLDDGEVYSREHLVAMRRKLGGPLPLLQIVAYYINTPGVREAIADDLIAQLPVELRDRIRNRRD